MTKTALLFAGQGAQTVGMGKDLAEAFPSAQSLFDRANEILDYDLARICFEGPEDELTKTEHAQPAIYLVSWVAYQLLKERVPSFAFDATAGLSLGEFTALAAANVFDFATGLKLVRQRGIFMQEACDATKGGMAAIIGLDPEVTKTVAERADVEMANLNCPGQIVISGDADKIEAACELAKEQGAKKATPLKVAGAYHSRLMRGAKEKLERELEPLELFLPKVPVISNVTAEPHGEPTAMADSIGQQVISPVRWEDSIRYLIARGFNRLIELGPGKALSGFMKRIDKTVEVLGVRDAESLDQTVAKCGADPH